MDIPGLTGPNHTPANSKYLKSIRIFGGKIGYTKIVLATRIVLKNKKHAYIQVILGLTKKQHQYIT